MLKKEPNVGYASEIKHSSLVFLMKTTNQTKNLTQKNLKILGIYEIYVIYKKNMCLIPVEVFDLLYPSIKPWFNPDLEHFYL